MMMLELLTEQLVELLFTNVLVNDALNQTSITNPALVTTTFVSSTNPNITLSGTNVVVALTRLPVLANL
jgi:hypothetical protein